MNIPDHAPTYVLRTSRNVVNKTRSNDPERDDLIQEAALHVLNKWETDHQQDDMPRPYIHAEIRRALGKAERYHRKWTGHPGNKANGVDPLRRPGQTSRVDDFTMHHDQPAHQRGFSDAEWRTLRPRITAAINNLPTPLQRTVARHIYQGHNPSEAGEAAGTTADSGRAAWRKARAHLAHDLADLHDLIKE